MNESHSEGEVVRLSRDELVAMTRSPSCGGKSAHAEQKRLRAQYLANGVWEIDLNDSPYNRKQLLKAMPEAKSRPLVGAGVVKFSFRLLQNVMDHNYVKSDSGERQIFEIECADGERWPLYFHKNGRGDNPDRIPPISSTPTAVLQGQPMNNSSGSAAPPAHEQGST